MHSNEARQVSAKIKQIFGEIPEDIRQQLSTNKAAFEIFVRNIATQIDSLELLTLITFETGSPFIIHDMKKFANEVANELINPEEVSVEK